MLYYFTFSQKYSGIYESQVIDVVNFIENEFKKKITLLAFIPFWGNFKDYKYHKSIIKSKVNSSIILPCLPNHFPRFYMYFYIFFLFFFKKRNGVICRDVIPTYLMIKTKFYTKNKICYDGRGAVIAQMEEYNIYHKKLKKFLYEIEPYVVNHSDFRIAVSNNLVKHWKEKFNYSQNKHVVIPTTISRNLEINISKKDKSIIGFNNNDIVLVYSGSDYSWQSFELIIKFIEEQLLNNELIRVLFLSKENPSIIKLKNLYKNKIQIKWVDVNQVNNYLINCDYGLILREDTITNNVSSPTKIGEYLFAGLKLIITENIEIPIEIKEKNIAIAYNQNNPIVLHKNNESRIINDFALKYYSKNSSIHKEKYNFLLKKIT